MTTADSYKDNQEIVVKFMARGMTLGQDPGRFTRMLPGKGTCWDKCRFVFDVDCETYDWLVVYHDVPGDGSTFYEVPLHCPREHTILLTPEPSSITVYGTDYLKQYGTVITFHEPWAMSHHNIVHQVPGLLWYYGLSVNHGTYMTYDELKEEKPEKSEKISTVCSNKKGKATIHSSRLAFVERLKQDIPELEVFGHGVRPMDDKAESLRPYEYHIVIENHVAAHHLTEKLPDAFLGHTLPFYHGAPNASDYFPKESFISIDISDYPRSLDIIRSHINNNEYGDRLPYIEEARRRVLDELNMFSIINREIDRQSGSQTSLSYGGVIMNRQTLRLKRPLAGIRSILEKAYVKARHRFGSS